MTSNINQVANNFLFDLVDVTQLSTKTLEDYSIVNRKHLEKIINNSERQLTEHEHRWLIKRDCTKVISDIKKYTRRRKSTTIIQEVEKEENNVGISPYANMSNRYILTNSVFYNNIMSNILNSNSEISSTDRENYYNIIVENNLTVINVNQLNININNVINDNNCTMFENDINGTVETNDSEVFIMDLERIYWEKWRQYVKNKMSVRKNRNKKIDSFLMKIQEKLNENQQNKNSKMHKVSKQIVPKQTKTVYDRQQVKIENQKKLLEKQQKEIERLKLQQLKLETEKAMLENQKLLDNTYKKSEKGLKIKNVPQKLPVLRASTTSDILNRMEMRALDRQAKWEAIKERRRKMEQEELRKKQELEEKCLKEQMEQRRKKMFEAREALRLKRIEECKQKIERDILRKNIKVADEFYRKLLIRKGFEAFTVNLKNTRFQMHKFANYYNRKILGMCFNKWRFFVNNTLNEKIFFAEQFYKQKLIKKAYFGFVKILEESKKKEQVAEDWSNFKIQEFWFQKWLTYVREINIETHNTMLEAESHHNRIIMKRCFDNWRKFPEIVYRERLKDCRLRMWHEKVQEILPDFIPPEF